MLGKSIVSLAVFVGLSVQLAGCAPGGGNGADGAGPVTEIPPVKAAPNIIAEGVVLPRQYAALSMLASGTVAEVLIREGDTVVAGAPLIRLENKSQRAAVSEAEAAVRAVEARLEELKGGARVQEIEAAEAQVDAAKARLGRLLEDPRSSDLAAAQASLDEARAALDDLLDGPSAEDLASAAARRANAAAALQQAQSAYDAVKWFDGVGQLPQSLELAQATNDYEAANAAYQALIDGPSAAEIAAERARVRKAEAELDRVRQSARASEIAEAEAEVRRTQADLDLLKAGTRPEQIAKAEADVVAAYATLRKAQAVLADSELRAPFDGTIAWLATRVGERADPGKPIVQLADLTSWVIETDDLTEIEVVDVRIGDPAVITFDAIPQLKLPGHVVWITPYGEEKAGDITYTVRVCPDEEDARLRWNMTAIVNIEPVEHPAESAIPACTDTPVSATPATSASPPATVPSVTEEMAAATLQPGSQRVPARTVEKPTGETLPSVTATAPLPIPAAATAVRTTAMSTTVPEPAAIPTVTATVTRTLRVEILAPGLNVREGPGITYPTVGYLNRGEQPDVIGRDESTGWFQILFPSGPDGKGWITDKTDYVQMVPAEP